MQTATDRITAEAQLIEMLRSRNVQAVELLYEQYASLLYGIIHRIVNDTKSAEKILFKTFTHTWNHYNHYDNTQQSICIWMMSIARQLSLDSLSPVQRMNVESRMLNSIKQTEMKEEVSVLELVFFGGLTVNKIAEQLGCSESHVRTLLHQSITRMKNESSPA